MAIIAGEQPERPSSNLVRHYVTRVREVRIVEELEILTRSDVDLNPFAWNDWESAIEETGIKPNVTELEHIAVRTDVISFAQGRTP